MTPTLLRVLETEMSNALDEFRKLLKDGLWAVKRAEGTSIASLQMEIDDHLGRKGSGSTVEYWRKGHLPPKQEDIAYLARFFAQRGLLSRDWIIKFLTTTEYPYQTVLCHELFPNSNSGRPEAIRSEPLRLVESEWQRKATACLELHQDLRLFGLESFVAQLTEYLLDSTENRIFAIYGIGGIGKTTLADAVVRQPEMGQRFEQLAWVTVKQTDFIPELGITTNRFAISDVEGMVDSLLSQLNIAKNESLPPHRKQELLQHYLQRSPTLIVVDNIEDIADVRNLIPFLRSLTKPGKVLITSRYQLPEASDVTHIQLGQIGQQYAFDFLRYTGKMASAMQLASATDEELEMIYARVGGNPLALRLVASQIQFLSLPAVLQYLSTLPDDEIDTFYSYIFHRSWQLLSSASQKLLTVMPLVDNAIDQQLTAISQLVQRDLHSALRQLARLSMIEVRGDLHTRRYAIHRLTETFLQKQVLSLKAATSQTNGKDTLFTLGVQRNLLYWRAWLEVHQNDIKKLDRERSAIVKAIQHGLNTLDSLTLAYELIEQFSPYLERRGQWERWNQILDNAIVRASETGHLSYVPPLSLLRARLFKHQSRFREAVSEYHHAIRVSRYTDDHVTRARAWSNLGHLYIELDHWWRAEILCIHALRIFEEKDSSHGRAHTHNHLGILYTRQCRWKNAWQHLEKACSLWQEMGATHGLLLANLNLGKLAVDMRMEGIAAPYPAYDFLRKAIRYGRQTADEVLVGMAQMNLGAVYRLDGRIEEAAEVFRTAKKIFDHYGDSLGIAMSIDNLGVICADMGRMEQAFQYFRESLEKWRALGSHYGEIRTLLYLAEWESQIGNKRAAKRWLGETDKQLTQYGQGTKYQALQVKFERVRSSLSS